MFHADADFVLLGHYFLNVWNFNLGWIVDMLAIDILDGVQHLLSEISTRQRCEAFPAHSWFGSGLVFYPDWLLSHESFFGQD